MVNITGFAQHIPEEVIENLPEINSSKVFSGLWNSIPPEIVDKIGLFLDVGRYLLIAIIIFIVFIIIKQLFKLKDSYRLKTIAKNSKEINKKLGILVEKEEKDEKKKEKKK